MKIVFTRGNSILSKFICWLSGDPVSHMAIVFDDKLVFHSNLLGVHITWYNTFLKKSQVVLFLEYTLTLEKEEEVYSAIINNFDGKSYDYGALLFFFWRGCLYKFFNIPLPSRNLWGDRDRFLCDELVQVLPERFRVQGQVDLLTPYHVYLDLKQRNIQ